MRKLLQDQLATLGEGKAPIYYPEHHLSHAASAFLSHRHSRTPRLSPSMALENGPRRP